MLRGIGRKRTGNSRPAIPFASMAAWFRKGYGVTQVANAVSAWADQTGNGRNLVQATGAAQPTLQSDATILFDGTGDYLQVAFTLNQPTTVYLRLKQVTWTINDSVFDGGVLNGGSLYQNTATPNLTMFAGLNAPSSTSLAVNTWGSVAAVFNAASSVLQVGASTATGSTGTNNMGGLTLGASASGVNFGNIQVAEVIVYSEAHDATTRAQVIAYLDTL